MHIRTMNSPTLHQVPDEKTDTQKSGRANTNKKSKMDGRKESHGDASENTRSCRYTQKNGTEQTVHIRRENILVDPTQTRRVNLSKTLLTGSLFSWIHDRRTAHGGSQSCRRTKSQGSTWHIVSPQRDHQARRTRKPSVLLVVKKSKRTQGERRPRGLKSRGGPPTNETMPC